MTGAATSVTSTVGNGVSGVVGVAGGVVGVVGRGVGDVCFCSVPPSMLLCSFLVPLFCFIWAADLLFCSTSLLCLCVSVSVSCAERIVVVSVASLRC